MLQMWGEVLSETVYRAKVELKTGVYLVPVKTY